MDIAPITTHGWTFEIIDSKLSITSEQNTNQQIHMSAQAAFSLLDYLYHERDELAQAAQQETSEDIDEQKAELRSQHTPSEGMTNQD